MDRPHILPLYTETVTHTVFDLLWIPRSCRLVELGQEPRGTGALNVWKMEEDKLSLVTSHSKASGFRCGSAGLTVLPHRRLTTGDFDGRVMVWDIESFEKPLWVQKGHSVVNTIDSGRGGLIISGGREGKVNVWDVRMDKPAIVYEGEVSGDQGADQSVNNTLKVPECWGTSILPRDSTAHIACGWESGDVKVWDIRGSEPLYQTRLQNGVCSVTLDDGNINGLEVLYIGTLEGHVYAVDISHPEYDIMEKTRMAHCNPCKSSIWKVSPYPRNHTVLAVPSGDGSVRLLKHKLCRWDKKKLKTFMEQKESRTGSQSSSFTTIGIRGDDGGSNSYNNNNTEISNPSPATSLVPFQKGLLHQVYDMQLAMQAIPSVSWNPERPGLLAWSGFDQTINIGMTMNLDKI